MRRCQMRHTLSIFIPAKSSSDWTDRAFTSGVSRSQLMCLPDYTHSSFSLHQKLRITRMVSLCAVSSWSLQRYFYHHRENNICSFSAIHLPLLSQHTHTLPLSLCLLQLQQRVPSEKTLFFLMTLILSDQIKIVINFHQKEHHFWMKYV